MAGGIAARPLVPEDAEVLRPIDQEYALFYDLEPLLTRSSLSFYARSGHAFVADRQGEVTGFVFAQAIWNGIRPALYINRLAAAEDDLASREALIAGVTKSAYDAAVYDIVAEVPESDRLGRQVLEASSYIKRPVMLYLRVLGTRGGSID